ncbi:nucleotidyltransferase family protein [bacterium]|nr:nucleotidyltransferase family protein [bacterium]
MTTTTTPDFPPVGALRGAERQRVLKLAGLLTRPALEERHIRAAERLIGAPDWQPIPRLIMLHAIEPLFRHHAAALGVAPDRLVDLSDTRYLPEAMGFRAIATRHYRRREVLLQVLKALHSQGVSRPMLIKGAALAPLYSSPALREMSDIDLVVDPSDEPRVTRAFESAGWKGGPATWSHDTGLTADIQIPRPGIGRETWRRRESHPIYGERFGICTPRASDHIVLTAVHAAQHSGTRLWRDICDLQLLLENGRRADLAAEALEHAAAHGAAPAVAAIFRIMNRWTAPLTRLPERSEDWTSAQEVACKLHCRLYRELAADRVSNAALEMATTFALPFPLLVAGAGGVVLRKLSDVLSLNGVSRSSQEPSERDPVMGDLPAAGSLKRQVLKLRLLAYLARSGEGRRYWKILRMRPRVALKARPFEPLKLATSEDTKPPI